VALACDACTTPVHGECAAIHGRCVTLGCASTSFSHGGFDERTRLEPSLPLSWLVRTALSLPRDDVALLVLALAGLVGLALLGPLQ